MKTVYDRFREHVETSPDRIAVHHRGKDVRYGELAAAATSMATWLLQEGLQHGDRVALLISNSAEFIVCYLGILQAGGVVVALNPETTDGELSYTLNDAAPVAVVTGSTAELALAKAAPQLSSVRLLIHLAKAYRTSFPQHWQMASLEEICRLPGTNPPESPRLDDVAQIIYTSGTTGRPKGVTLSHRNIATNCNSILSYLDLTCEDSVFVTLPFFYSYGNSLLFTHLAVGGRLVLASDFVFWNRALDLMQQQRATGFSGVPSTFAMLLHKSDFRSRKFRDLRYLTCAGGALAPAVVKRLQAVVPQVRLFLMYGQTEATARLSTLLPEQLDEKLGSIGRGIQGITLDVLDERGSKVQPGEVGEIVAQGENLMVGYWNDPDETKRVLRPEGLWTGDLARLDQDGFIFIVGRKSDIIKSGAYRISPQEIEEAILKHEGIAEVAVVGLPDEIWGEAPVAFVLLSPTGTALTGRDVLDHCRQRLPRHKMIREVRFVESLPKTSSGKIKRTEMRDAAGMQIAPSGSSALS